MADKKDVAKKVEKKQDGFMPETSQAKEPLKGKPVDSKNDVDMKEKSEPEKSEIKDSKNVQSNSGMQEGKKSNSTIVVAIIIIAVIAGFVYFMSGDSSPEEPNIDNSIETPEENSASSEVVARVNGEDVTMGEVDQAKALIFSQSGQQVDTQTAVDQVISEKVLLGKAEELGVIVTTQQAETALVGMLSQRGLTLDDVKQASIDQGSDYSTELESFRRQAIISKLIAEEVGTPEINEEETLKYYEENKELLFPDGNVPAFEDVSAQLNSALVQREIQIEFAEYVDSLRAESEIEYFLEETQESNTLTLELDTTEQTEEIVDTEEAVVN